MFDKLPDDMKYLIFKMNREARLTERAKWWHGFVIVQLEAKWDKIHYKERRMSSIVGRPRVMNWDVKMRHFKTT